MKKTTRFISFLLSLLLISSLGITVFATPAPQPDESIATVHGASLISDLGDTAKTDADISDVQGETETEPQAPVEVVVTPKKNSNTPFFFGAGFAVLMFVGVALYCKAKGNKTY